MHGTLQPWARAELGAKEQHSVSVLLLLLSSTIFTKTLFCGKLSSPHASYFLLILG